ncbi:MAG: MFS transporter, partial [Pusillimonas sp.]
DLSVTAVWCSLPYSPQVFLHSDELGAAGAAYIIARVSNSHGRRVGLVAGYAACLFGSLVCVLAGLESSLILLTFGMIFVGAGLAGTWQARFAATDLAHEQHRGRAMSVVMWATAAGAAAGPALAGPAGDVALMFGLPRLTGGFLVAALGALIAGGWIALGIKVDPLLLARQFAPSKDSSRQHVSALSAVRMRRQVVYAILAIATAHAAMLAVMVIAPLQMQRDGASLETIGAVIGLHIAGMYSLSPLVGWCTDRIGPRSVTLTGATMMLTGVAVIAIFTSSLILFAVGLLSIGLGWSCTMIGTSTAITSALPLDLRPAVQGFSDLVMGGVGGLAGAIAGVVVGEWGFLPLSLAEAATLGITVLAALAIRHR